MSQYVFKPRVCLGAMKTPPLVPVKAPSALLTQPASIDHLDQQRARPIFGVAQPFVKDTHDVEADIKPNEVGQCKRSHRMRHSQFENFIDGFGSGYAFHDRVHSFV